VSPDALGLTQEIDWERAVAGVPSEDWLAGDLEDDAALDELLERFLWELEQGCFLRWEAIIRGEQRLALSEAHRGALRGLMSFGEAPERVLYIDEIERPRQPWYTILRALAPRLLVEPLKTSGAYFHSVTEGWPQLVEILEEKGADLSLPAGITALLEVLPTELRARLWLQSCCEPLVGIGQEPELTLADPEQRWRIEEFIDLLQDRADELVGQGLTLERLRRAVAFPPQEQPRFERLLSDALKLIGPNDPLLSHLRPDRV